MLIHLEVTWKPMTVGGKLVKYVVKHRKYNSYDVHVNNLSRITTTRLLKYKETLENISKYQKI